MKNNLVLTSGEYTYYKNAPEVGRIINGMPTGHGNDGKVVFYNKKNVMKLWYDQDSPYELLPEVKGNYIHNIRDLNTATYHYHYIYIPKMLVEYLGEVVGYLLSYFPGRNLDILSDLISFRSFLNGLKRLENKLLIFSQEGFMLNDIHPKNLMVLQKHKVVSFGLMDPDSWQKTAKDFQKLYEHNINEVRNIIFAQIITKPLKEFIEANPNLRDNYALINNNQSTILTGFLRKLHHELEKEKIVKIKTMGDFRNI